MIYFTSLLILKFLSTMEINDIKKQLTIRNVLAYYGIHSTKKYIHCPFHQENTEKKMSMLINDKTNTVYCFSSKCKCGMKIIDVIDFVMHKENTDKHGALLKAGQLIEQGFISECNNVSIKQCNNENTNESMKANINELANYQINELKILHEYKLQYQTENLNYYIVGGLPKTLDSLKVTQQPLQLLCYKVFGYPYINKNQVFIC